jgi:PPOX class probable F420-dependent enzyme
VDEDEALRRLAGARVARMATVTPAGRPHVVPVVFVVEGRTLCWAVDRKPKRSTRLQRLENIRANPVTEVVVDQYLEDWSGLWWVRAEGQARIVESGDERDGAMRLLADKYPQYRTDPPLGPVVAVGLERISWWDGQPRSRQS